MSGIEQRAKFEMPVSPIVAAAAGACLISLTVSCWLGRPVAGFAEANAAWWLLCGAFPLLATFLVLHCGHWRGQMTVGPRFWYLLGASILILMAVTAAMVL